MFITITFLSVLTAFRFVWLHFYTTPDHPHAYQGKLDLRNWNQLVDNSITLDGEWEFHPNLFLMEEAADTSLIVAEGGTKFAQVPGDWNAGGWNSSEETDTRSTYGFGSYRLRIQVDPDQGDRYGIRIPSIHSSSELYINGKLLKRSGQPAKDKQSYIPLNVPYTAYFTSEGTAEIELIIQVANYDDVRSGGIVRSVKFGLADSMNKYTSLTTGLLIVACAVYLIHALYSFVLYLTGGRDRRLLYFSLMIICIVLGTLIDGQRLLFAWIPFNYEWSVKGTYLVMISGGYFLLQCIRHKLPDLIRFKGFILYAVLSCILSAMILLLPASANLLAQTIYSFVILIPCVLALWVMCRATTRMNRDNIFLLLAAIAAIGSLIWLFIIDRLQIDIVSYPFDLMIALICFATYWFKQYFQVLAESQQLAKKLQQEDKNKDDFLATVAHELRNPLHGILSITQTVSEREKDTLEEKSARDLELLNIVGRSMSMLLNDLLELAKLKEKRVLLQPSHVSVHSAAEAVIDMLQYMTDGKPIRLINSIPSSFPLVVADENRLIQILLNLLHNAIKYSQAGEVSVYASMKGEWAQISVKDTGIGLDEEFLDKIFEPYERGSNDITSNPSGFGLGLSICKQLVEMHGGMLEVSSKPNQGSVFTFTLKLSDSSTPTKGVTGSRPQVIDELAASAQALMKKKASVHQVSYADPVRILAVDDDPVNLKVLESIFSIAPYVIVTVSSGKEALSLLAAGEWDLVITDVMMPNMSGY